MGFVSNSVGNFGFELFVDSSMYFLGLFSGGNFVSINSLDGFIGNDNFFLVIFREFGGKSSKLFFDNSNSVVSFVFFKGFVVVLNYVEIIVNGSFGFVGDIFVRFVVGFVFWVVGDGLV